MIPKLIQTKYLIGVSGIVLWPFVFVLRLDNILLRHEYIHVIQIRRSVKRYGKIGVLYWYCSYIWELKKAGFSYYHNKYEWEAFKYQGNETYIQVQDPELWEKIKHNFTNYGNSNRSNRIFNSSIHSVDY